MSVKLAKRAVAKVALLGLISLVVASVSWLTAARYPMLRSPWQERTYSTDTVEYVTANQLAADVQLAASRAT